jgi:16S rRNA (adenine1518-N6/adenine1519-N6)-dimethyltransferase
MHSLKQKILDLPPVSEVLNKHGFFTKKNLGQNFIFDLNVTNKIVRYAGNLEGYTVIEIGGGGGSLTRSILMANPDKLIIIEKDERCIPLLEELKEISEDKLEIINEDALNFDYKIFKGKKVKIIANLPYNIGTELLFKWYDDIEIFTSLTLMFQKEVAERICAEVSEDAYSRISVISAILCNCEKLFDVPPTVFFPQPKVYSSVISLSPKNKLPEKEILEKIKKLSKFAFMQKRKTIKNSLENLLQNNTLEILEKANINPKLRAENLSPEDYKKIATIVD